MTYDPTAQAEYLSRMQEEWGWEGVAYYVHNLVADNKEAVREQIATELEAEADIESDMSASHAYTDAARIARVGRDT